MDTRKSRWICFFFSCCVCVVVYKWIRAELLISPAHPCIFHRPLSFLRVNKMAKRFQLWIGVWCRNPFGTRTKKQNELQPMWCYMFIPFDSILHNSQTWSAQRTNQPHLTRKRRFKYRHAMPQKENMHKQQYFFMWYLVSNKVKWSMCSHLANGDWCWCVSEQSKQKCGTLSLSFYLVCSLFLTLSFFVHVYFIWIDCRLALQSVAPISHSNQMHELLIAIRQHNRRPWHFNGTDTSNEK